MRLELQPLSRRQVLALSAGALALPVVGCGQAAEAPPAEATAIPPAATPSGPLATRPIPVSGEQVPVTGMGTSQVYEYENDPAAHAERKATIQAFLDGGAKLIDTAPSYGNAETNIGLLLEELGAREQVFLATKVRARDDAAARQASLTASQGRLKTQTFDLMLAHNIEDANQDFGQLRQWKQQGVIRYWGITTADDEHYPAVEAIIRREKPDFLEIDYALDNRTSDVRVLPLARDSGVAVLTSLPFGRNSQFRKVGNTPLPDWAMEIDATSWAQVFLKFILSNPAVTAVIPGTDKPQYALDNIRAGSTALPDAAQRQRIIDWWTALPT
jgi:aryl-alcohol dehydrogenase-like predicted oxidoreductase